MQLFRFLLILSICLSSKVNAQTIAGWTFNDMETVKDKLFPKDGKIEFSFIDAGLILNQAYVSSYALHGNLTYYMNEHLGLGLDFIYSMNTDSADRYCVENFYNDPQGLLAVECPSQGEDPAAPILANNPPLNGVNFGPAYPAVRELNYFVGPLITWAPYYGKQLLFISSTLYLDLFINFGIGVTASTFYPNSIFLRNGHLSRQATYTAQDNQIDPCDANIAGICVKDPNYVNLIGANGRPDPENNSNATLTFGIGQKFHFKKRFFLKMEFRTLALLGTPASFYGIDAYHAIWAGLGVRF